jgi:cell division protease FtsH
MSFKRFKGGSRNALLWAGILFVVSLIFLAQLTDYSRETKTLTYSAFLKRAEQGEVEKVQIDGQELYGVLKNKTHFETVLPQGFQDWDILRQHNVEVIISAPAGSIGFWHILLLLLLIGAPIVAWFMLRQARGAGNGGGGNVFSMGKSKARMFMPAQIKTNFNSVAGATEAKEDLVDVVDFLKNPEKYRRLGAKIPKGVLLVGEPGNGKTLLAKAVAGEANCPFFSISGSDFIEVFVGVGAARVRDLFAQARKHAPCIIFIDEIDAVGRQRGGGLGGGNDEREQTLNQLLTEMDGFDNTSATVVVLAATNRPDVLDKALLRPGRFDRRVDVPYPDVNSRDQILRVHAKNVKIDPSIDLLKIARGTPGFTGADLANLINEAAINASKKNEDWVTIADFEEARDRMLIGKELKTIVLLEDERKMTAYHEAGHALVRLLMPEVTDPLHKVTIVPRGGALGVTHSLPDREKYSQSKNEMLASIMAALGGRIAEEITFHKISTGAYSDFKAASNLARAMVCKYGMSEKLGPIVYDQHGEFNYSQETAQLIDREVRTLVEDCYRKAKDLLVANEDKLKKLSEALLEHETMGAQEIYELLDIPSRESHPIN